MKNFLAVLLPSILLVVSCYSQDNKIKTGFIKAGNFNVYYESAGSGNAILLLHAGLQDHTMWADQVNQLSKTYEIVTLDLPYHGKTTGVDTTLLAQDLIKVILDSLKLSKIFIAGLSMGASITQDFVIAHPERVNKAILISSGLNGFERNHPNDSISYHWWPLFKEALEENDTLRAAAEFTKAWAEGVYRRRDSLKSQVSQNVYKTTLANLRLHKMEGWPRLQDNPTAIERLGFIDVPVLIIDGDKDLPYITAASDYMEKNIPRAKRVTIKNAAHMLNIEKASKVNNLMIDFFKMQ